MSQSESAKRACAMIGSGEGLGASAVADAFWYLAHQDRSAWSNDLDPRPFKEKV